MNVWANALDVRSEGIQRSFDVVAGISLLHKQLARTREMLAHSGTVPESTYASQFTAVENLLNPVNLRATWGNVSNALWNSPASPDTTLSPHEYVRTPWG